MEPRLITIIPEFDITYATESDAQVWESEYVDNPVLALLITANNDAWPPEKICTPTVNLSGYGLFPEEGNVFIKNYAENEGVREVLEEAGIIGTAVQTVAAGHITVTEHRLLKRAENATDEADDHGTIEVEI